VWGCGHKRYIEYSEHIYKSGQHLLSLINDILDLSKMEEGRYEIKSSPQSLRAAVERAVGFLTFDIKDKKILIHMEIAPDFPKLDADERALTQIITNLLSNAVKFSNKEGDIYIHGWQREDGGISFHIKDTGVGMSPDGLKRAMEPFVQVDSNVARRYKGIGLGLPITKSLVEMHGGSIRIESIEGYGATVIVDLPSVRTVELEATPA
jgi:two-component system cell cycle sensor histidine kinase PleC